jgi:hypothetical protein
VGAVLRIVTKPSCGQLFRRLFLRQKRLPQKQPTTKLRHMAALVRQESLSELAG